MIWKKPFDTELLDRFRQGSLVEHLDIRFLERGDDFLSATMPVDRRTRQPMGLLHGGASVALAETLGSTAAYMTLEDGQSCVGLEIKANHLKCVSEGIVTGNARPVHLGRTTQVWDIDIRNGGEELVCVSRLTMAVLRDRS